MDTKYNKIRWEIFNFSQRGSFYIRQLKFQRIFSLYPPIRDKIGHGLILDLRVNGLVFRTYPVSIALSQNK